MVTGDPRVKRGMLVVYYEEGSHVIPNNIRLKMKLKHFIIIYLNSRAFVDLGFHRIVSGSI